MRITIAAAGRLKRAPEKDLCDDYLARTAKLGKQAGITAISVVEVPESRQQDAKTRKHDEAAQILAKVPDGARIVCLDENGDARDTSQFCELIRSHADGGTQDLAFLIGGPDGLDPELLRDATTTLSFGRMTWPHRLVRVMLTEQIYRAVTLMVNHPYHRV
ncbi:MAG: 23S rRNA (pseudouridine(1915)-N(3))-methyltransferase RlmH [Pseudomonadota bacterium]